MNSEFLDPDDLRCQRILHHLRHDIYYTPEYLRHAARYENATPVYFWGEVNGAELLIPLLIKALPECLPVPNDWCDAKSPYGYTGALMTADVDVNARRELFALFADAAADRGLVSVFLRQHPLLPMNFPDQSDWIINVHHGHTVFVDLKQRVEDLESQVRAGHRYEIRRLEREQFQVEMNNWKWLPEFIGLYRQTMLRVDARASYCFPDAYFHDLRLMLNGRLHLGTVVSPTGELSSASLFTECDGIVQYHLSATADSFLRKSPAKLLLKEVRSWAQQRGNDWLHLGGGLGGKEDALFRFKAGFSRMRGAFVTSRIVLNAKRYELCNQLAARANNANTACDDFFPPYRKAA